MVAPRNTMTDDTDADADTTDPDASTPDQETDTDTDTDTDADADDGGRAGIAVPGHTRDVSEIPEGELGAEYDAARDHLIHVTDGLHSAKRMYVTLDGLAENPYRQDTRATLRNAQRQLDHAADLLEAERKALDDRCDELHERLDDLREDTSADADADADTDADADADAEVVE